LKVFHLYEKTRHMENYGLHHHTLLL